MVSDLLIARDVIVKARGGVGSKRTSVRVVDIKSKRAAEYIQKQKEGVRYEIQSTKARRRESMVMRGKKNCDTKKKNAKDYTHESSHSKLSASLGRTKGIGGAFLAAWGFWATDLGACMITRGAFMELRSPRKEEEKTRNIVSHCESLQDFVIDVQAKFKIQQTSTRNHINRQFNQNYKTYSSSHSRACVAIFFISLLCFCFLTCNTTATIKATQLTQATTPRTTGSLLPALERELSSTVALVSTAPFFFAERKFSLV